MNELIRLARDRTAQRGLTLILTRDRARRSKTDLIASLILRGPLFLVSGDEWIPAFELPRLIRARTSGVRAVLGGLRTVRASTCYRLLDSLAGIPSAGEPILVTDFLHTFYDDDIPLRARCLRLRACCQELRRLALSRALIVLTQEQEGAEYEAFEPALRSLADRTFTLAPEPERIEQPALF